jgi:hypothetical protein
MRAAGRVVVSVHGSNGELFTGVGALGRRRRFDWPTITDVVFKTKYVSDSDGSRTMHFVVLKSDGKELTFGRLLSFHRCRFVAFALQSFKSKSPSGAAEPTVT